MYDIFIGGTFIPRSGVAYELCLTCDEMIGSVGLQFGGGVSMEWALQSCSRSLRIHNQFSHKGHAMMVAYKPEDDDGQ